MSSSTSSSRRGAAESPRLHLALFAGTFLVLAGVSSLAWQVVPFGLMVLKPPAPERHHYLCARGFGGAALDHHVLFHGWQNTTKHMRAADVLLLGNSRLMAGLPDHLARKSFAQLGLKHYFLGFGGEGDLFPLDIIRKNDLRPQYVVIHAEYSFFVGQYSSQAKKVAEETAFEGRKLLFEENMAHVVQTGLHQVLPPWMFIARQRHGLVGYRSRRDGSWSLPREYPWAYPIKDNPGPRALTEQQKECASRFKAEMDRRGTRIILTFVPSDDGNRRHAELVAQHLDVPLIAPDLPGLETWDYSHLTHASAVRFGSAFFDELAASLRSSDLRSASRGR